MRFLQQRTFLCDIQNTERNAGENIIALRDATKLMDDSKFLRSVMGDDVIDHYVHTANWEQFEFDRRITDLELKRGFERY